MPYELLPPRALVKEPERKYELLPPPNEVEEFFSQIRQVPMQAIGQPGLIAESLREAAEKTGKIHEKEMPYIPGGEFAISPQAASAALQAYLPEKGTLPTPESIGERLGYKEPTTFGGRAGKAIFSGVGRAIPVAAATALGQPGAVLPEIASSTLGSTSAQAARELGAPEEVATLTDILSTLSPSAAKEVANLASKRGWSLEKLRNIFGKEKPSYEKITEKAENLIKPAEIPFGKKVRPPEIKAKVSPETEQISKVAKAGERELGPTGPMSIVREAKRSIKPEERIGESVSNFKISSKRGAAENTQNILRHVSDQEYKKVNKLYDISEKLNSNITDFRSDLLNKVEDRISKLERQGARKYDAQAMDIMEDLRDFLSRGPITNQDLINRERQVRKYLQFKYAHDPKNVFQPIINDIQAEIARTAKGNPKAYQAYINAKASNVLWNEKYNNKYIRDYLDLQNKDYNRLYNNLLDEDVYNVLSPVLEEQGHMGKNIAQSLKREMTEKDLKPYIYHKDGSLNFNAKNSPEFREKLQSIDYLSQKEKNDILKEVSSWRRQSREAKLLERPKKKESKLSKHIERGTRIGVESAAALSPIPIPEPAKKAASEYISGKIKNRIE